MHFSGVVYSGEKFWPRVKYIWVIKFKKWELKFILAIRWHLLYLVKTSLKTCNKISFLAYPFYDMN